MTRIRPLAFLDTAALIALSAVLLAAASWTQAGAPLPGTAMVNPDLAVAVALADDTGLVRDDVSETNQP